MYRFAMYRFGIYGLEMFRLLSKLKLVCLSIACGSGWYQ